MTVKTIANESTAVMMKIMGGPVKIDPIIPSVPGTKTLKIKPTEDVASPEQPHPTFAPRPGFNIDLKDLLQQSSGNKPSILD